MNNSTMSSGNIVSSERSLLSRMGEEMGGKHYD